VTHLLHARHTASLHSGVIHCYDGIVEFDQATEPRASRQELPVLGKAQSFRHSDGRKEIEAPKVIIAAVLEAKEGHELPLPTNRGHHPISTSLLGLPRRAGLTHSPDQFQFLLQKSVHINEVLPTNEDASVGYCRNGKLHSQRCLITI